jgi:hypothetical protein
MKLWIGKMSASNPSKPLSNSIQPLLPNESEAGWMSRFDQIKTHLEKIKGLVLRLSMRIPAASQRV